MSIISSASVENLAFGGKRRITVWPEEYLAPHTKSRESYFDHIYPSVDAVAEYKSSTAEAKDQQAPTGAVAEIAVAATVEGAAENKLAPAREHVGETVAAATVIATPDILALVEPTEVGANA